MKFHEVCELFPEMQPADFDALVENIRLRGVQVPVLIYQGKIIDGRHRWRACEKLGIECPTKDWYPRNSESLVEFVVSLNLHRRTLTASQRAMIAQAMLPLLEAEGRERQSAGGGAKSAVGKIAQSAPPPPKRSRDAAAKATGTSGRYVQDAKAVKEKSPELAEKVKSGEITLPEAKKQLKAPPPPPPKKQTPASIALSQETAKRFTELATRAHALKRDILALAGEPVGRELRAQDFEREFKNMAAWLRAATPYKACPFRGCGKTCKACKGTGWLNEQIYNNIPAEVKG